MKLFVAKHASRVEILEHLQIFPWNWSKLENFCLNSNFNRLIWKLIWKSPSSIPWTVHFFLIRLVALGLTLISLSYESKKNAHLKCHLGASFIRLNELGRLSKYPDWSQFSPSKWLEIFDEIQSKNYKDVKSALPHANYG